MARHSPFHRAPLQGLLLLTLVTCLFSTPLLAWQGEQGEPSARFEVSPERMGFEPGRVQVDGESVAYFLSTEGRPVDRARRLPLIVFLQGSGAAPIYFGTAPRVGRSTLFNPTDFLGHHYVVISKPGIPFYAEQRVVASEEYDRRTSLPSRVASVKAVVAFLAKQSWVDATRIALLGHSEGADVAPWAAVACRQVTHVIALAPGAVSQMLEFTIMERKKAARGEQTAADADQRIRDNLEAYREIYKDPGSWAKKWRGHSYLRWSSFARPAMEAYRSLDIPILAIAGREDRNTPCESGEALQLEYIRTGKKNLTFELWPVNHYLSERVEGASIDRRKEIGQRVLQWLQASGREDVVDEAKKGLGR